MVLQDGNFDIYIIFAINFNATMSIEIFVLYLL
jgi:hypothetical protein